MPRVNHDNLYALFQFDNPEEAALACQFSRLQLARLYNLRTQAATGKANAACPPGLEQAYIQQQEFYRGQIEILSQLIDDHELAEQASMQANRNREEG